MQFGGFAASLWYSSHRVINALQQQGQTPPTELSGP